MIKSFLKLKEYCESNDFKGYDVGDSIESPIITNTFLGKYPIVRFVIQQLTGHRLAFLNFRPLLFIPQYYNAKGIALFLNGYCNLYDIINLNNNIGITKKECLIKINYLSDLLISLKNNDYHGAGWGYPMSWQGRISFYFPANTPTIVASSFSADALFHAFEITGNKLYKDVALETADFILKDLHKTPFKEGFLFSYSPYKGNDTVYNASLLGGRTLAQCYKYSNNKEFLKIAKQCIDTCVKEQKEDGSWIYGIGSTQKWIDNFHTGYNLESIREYQNISGDMSYARCIEKGLSFMLNNHFDKHHIPKYYANKQYPIDIHCCGEIFVVLHKLGVFKENEKLADDIFHWTIKNMYNEKKGFFYFQKRRWITNKCPLMRWSEAFMFNALSYYIKSKNSVK